MCDQRDAPVAQVNIQSAAARRAHSPMRQRSLTNDSPTISRAYFQSDFEGHRDAQRVRAEPSLVHGVCDELDAALACVSAMFTKYPAAAIATTTAKTPITIPIVRSTRLLINAI